MIYEEIVHSTNSVLVNGKFNSNALLGGGCSCSKIYSKIIISSFLLNLVFKVVLLESLIEFFFSSVDNIVKSISHETN